MEAYYSTTTFLTIAINRHLYDDKHFTYVAEGFYPYGKGNPKSSNPLLIYMDLYQPWQDKDPYDKFVLQHRMSVRKGIIEQRKSGVISKQVAKDLKRVADRIDLEFFFPVVLKVKIDVKLAVSSSRASIAGSGLTGSSEFLIPDLNDTEFELLFNDNSSFRFDPFKNPFGSFASKVDAVNELLKWSP